MTQDILRRMLLALLTVWAAATLAFFALALIPGDAIQSQLAQSGVSTDDIEIRRAALGLTDAPVIRYVRFLGNLLRGDLGVSWLSGEEVSTAIARNFVPTLRLALVALVLSCILGVVLGTFAARENRWLASSARFVISLAMSTPIYWTGTLAIHVFTARLGLLPSAGAGRLGQLVLPASILGFHSAAAIARVLQTNIRAVRQTMYVRTAYGKGLSERRIMLRHILPVALLPVIGVIALQAGFLLNGTVITESLFVRPGLGRLLLDATVQQDYPLVLGVVILAAVVYTLVNLAADLVLHLIDPRVRQ